MIDYFDASAIAAIVLREPASAAVAGLVTSTSATIVVTEFALTEVSSAISRLVRTEERSRAAADSLVMITDAWVDDVAALIDVQSLDFARATELVRDFDLKLRAPDALHLAIAERLEARLITLDHNLAAAARAIGANVHNPAETSLLGEPKD